MTTQSSTEVFVGSPPSGRPNRTCRSTKRDDFVYACYSSSFSSIVAYVHHLHKPVSYREVVCVSLWQASHDWYETFATVVTSLGFVSSHLDSALVVKHSSVGRILLSLYVDDMIITGDDRVGIESLKLGKNTLPYGDLLPDPSLYQTIVGSLVYLTITHPNISYAVHIVIQFVTAPTTVHWVAVLHILRYLRGDFVSRNSTTRFCIFLGDSLFYGRVRNKMLQKIARNSVFHEGTKRIEIDCHFTRHHL
ncbi:putative mitochondrial protein [Tanacetum coccineum]